MNKQLNQDKREPPGLMPLAQIQEQWDQRKHNNLCQRHNQQAVAHREKGGQEVEEQKVHSEKKEEEFQAPGVDRRFSRLLNRVLGVFSKSSKRNLRDSIEDFLDEPDLLLNEEELGFSHDQRLMMANILKLGETKVEDIAVPRIDIKALPLHSNFTEVLASFQRYRHTRLPVYKETLDNTIGFVHLRDVLSYLNTGNSFKLEEALHEPLIVSPAMPASSLLLRMRMRRIHLALMVDEFGGIDGLVTIENLIEEVVGDIEDEYNTAVSPQLVPMKNGWQADARVTIEEFEAVFGSLLTPEEEEDNIDTLGGLVVSLAGYVPAKGEVLVHETSNLEFRVIDADPRRVLKLAIHRKKQSHDFIKDK